jgi:hypothetical protein
MRGHIAVLVAAAVLGLLAAAPARCEDVRVEAAVDTKNVEVGENLTLTLTVYGDAKVSQPDLSGIDGFEVAGSYSSQSISIVNARMSKSVSLQYVLVALREGEFTLGPFSVVSGNTVYQTQAIPVRVTAAGTGTPGTGTRGNPAAPRSGIASQGSESEERAIRAFAAVDKKRAYVGEQITYTLTFAYRADVQDATFEEPEHTGFWSESIGQSSPQVRTIEGEQYYVVTKSLAFFPISSGRFTLGEAGIRYIVEDRTAFGRDPFSFFSRDPFRRREGVAKAGAIEIEVLPLPAEGKPADFSGAVGTFTLSAAPSPREVRVGESITLSVRVEGQGNIKSISEIPIPEFDGFRVFAPKARDSVRVERGRIGGAKIFDLVLVPQRVGDFSLEGLTLAYFDPAEGAYVRRSASPVQISVLEGDESTMRALAAADAGRPTRQEIRHIKRPAGIADDLALLPGGAGGALVRAAPVLASLVGVSVMLRRRHMATTGKARVRDAAKTMAKDLGEAREMAGRGAAAEASGAASRAIRAYVAVRKGTSESLVDSSYLTSLGEIPADLRSEVGGLLSVLDQVRFSPVGSSPEGIGGLVAEAERLAARVDREWREEGGRR